MAVTLSPTRRRRLVGQLRRAQRTLDTWMNSLTGSIFLGKTASDVVPPADRSVIQLMHDVRTAVHRRLAELEAEQSGTPLPHGEVRSKHAGVAKRTERHRSMMRLYLRACRCCGKALGVAFKVAAAVADVVSVRLLYAAVRAFEKQLWLLDPRMA